MKEHHAQYRITGNCFDLALWLLHEFETEGVEAYPIGHDLGTPGAHAAVIAINAKGNRYYCDLGDQWLEPILVDPDSEDYAEQLLPGFFPAADVQLKSDNQQVTILYRRANGKSSKQCFSLAPIELQEFKAAAEISQGIIKKHPLLECRIPYKAETAHWEFYNWGSFLSTREGLFEESTAKNIEEWCERIHQTTDYDKGFLYDALHIYKNMK